MSGSFSDSFFPSPTTPDEIINIVSSLKSSNSEGEDGINVNVIKASIDLLASPLSQMCKCAIGRGLYPRGWGTADNWTQKSASKQAMTVLIKICLAF